MRGRLSTAALGHPVRTLLITYAGSRLLVLLALAVAAHWFQNPAGVGHLEPGLGDMFGLWDATWYRDIALHGYPVPAPIDPRTGTMTYSAWAFFPLLPWILTPLTRVGLPFVASAVVLDLLLGGVATVLVWRLFRGPAAPALDPVRERLALVAAALWCLHPATTVLLQPYTEALAAALLTGAVLLVMRRRYVGAGVLALALGLTRAVAPALGLVVLVHLAARWRAEVAVGARPLAGGRLGAAFLLVATAVSGVLWPAIVGVRTGVPNAFFAIQANWGQRPEDGPFVAWVRWAWQSRGALGVVTLLLCVVAYVALVLGRHGRWLSVEVRALALAYPLYLLAVVRPITSMWRFTLLDVPLAALLASVCLRTWRGGSIVPHWVGRAVVVGTALCAGVLWWTSVLWVYLPWGSHPP